MNINETVLEKLRKILVLASDKAATAGEIEAAMAKAKAIAMQHSIDLADICLSDPKSKSTTIEVKSDESIKLGVAFWRKYHPWVFHVLSEVFAVKFVTNRYKEGSRERCNRIWVLGETTDVEIVKAMFPWLEALYPKSFLHAVNSMQITVNNAATQHGFYRGLTAGILEANRKEEAKVQGAQGQKWAMVVRTKMDAIAQRMAEMFPDMEAGKACKARGISHQAAAVGYARGKQVNLNQVGSTKPGSQLH